MNATAKARWREDKREDRTKWAIFAIIPFPSRLSSRHRAFAVA
jgi:hypothetical protein